MKHIKIYINERLHLTSKQRYTCHPRKTEKLKKIIIQRIQEDGPDCDLNDIDVSHITDMSNLFRCDRHELGNEIFHDFNGDISRWNVSNVKNMFCMFTGCEQFNCDISKWDVSNVYDMSYIFCNCKEFNCDISHWNVSNVKNMGGVFYGCEKFNCDLSRWDVSNAKNMPYMFKRCKSFRQDIDGWNVSNVTIMIDAFNDCPTQPEWYRNK